ncbi:MAG: hypothetical protein COA62_02740 [Rhodobiaceae bacterium]|nr:MAG: hypothetical protein COA62_02740 [Rhodobiaceae bacterium]
MRRFFKRVGLGLVAVTIGIYVYPWIDTQREQDGCSFGSVSNAEYRELLAEAHHLKQTVWAPLTREEIRKHIDGGGRPRGIPGPDQRLSLRAFQDGLSNLFAARFRTLVLKQDSVDGQVAAAHAVMRASGLFLSGSNESPTAGPQAGYSSGSGYKLDAGRIWRFYPFLRWVSFSVRISVAPAAPDRPVPTVAGYPGIVRAGQPRPPHMSVRAQLPGYYDGFPRKLFYFGNYGCPVIPSRALSSPASDPQK